MEIKCPFCKANTEKGYLTNHGMIWVNKTYAGFGFTKWITGGEIVEAYRCLNCKNIQLISNK